MKKIAAVIAMSLAAGSAMAQSRPSTLQLSCQAVARIVESNGAAVLGTGQFTYDRYVRDQNACYAGQTTRAAFVPTANQAQCFIGYTCVERERRNTRN